MVKNIITGIVPAVLLFLYYIGIDILPILFIIGMTGILYYILIRNNGKLSTASSTSKKNVHDNSKSAVNFADIGGLDKVKNELSESLDFLIHQEELDTYGIRPIKGILLDGPPGTGKTLLAKAAANYTNSVFIATSGSEFVEMYVGVGAKRIREMFNEARTIARKSKKESAIIFIDEIDVIGGKRDNNNLREYDQTLNQLLTEMDGIKSNTKPKILVMAATNRKDMLDNALIRPGRFDRHINVDLPDKEARKKIIMIHTSKKPISDNVDFDKLALETYGLSGAQLESVANEAAIYAFRETEKEISSNHFAKAIDKVLMGEQIDREATAEEKHRVAIHELGHAFIAEKLKPGSVSQIVLRPRGKALGYVRHNPEEDNYLHTQESIEKQIKISLGGAVAEEIYFGHRSTGSKNDFDQAINMVNYMIETGITSLGIVNINNISKTKLEEESQIILKRLLKEAENLLISSEKTLEDAVKYIKKEEVLSGDLFRDMLKKQMVS